MGPGKLPDPNDPRLFLNYNWREWETDTGHEFERPEGRPYVLRAYYLRKDPALGSWEGAVEAGVNVLATDWLSRLAVGSEPFDEI
ncbi:MAG: hypothetical protein HKN71_11215 [Gemmatimonadetes bacterium]|nr:hypothetical protein [Gemmatimonadota bacterium]